MMIQIEIPKVYHLHARHNEAIGHMGAGVLIDLLRGRDTSSNGNCLP
jgi:hypothetical protein